MKLAWEKCIPVTVRGSGTGLVGSAVPVCGGILMETTKMNKILFYADFLSYRQYGISISGLTYKALDYGPVPEHWDRIYSQFDEIYQEQRIIGEKEGIILKTSEKPDITTFTETEIQILQTICTKFRNTSATEISRISHNEPAWIECNPTHSKIPFNYAFTLKAI